MRSATRKPIYFAAAVGFCIPILWGMIAFVFFTAPESTRMDLFWYAVYVTCPPWLLPESSASWVLTPVANAILYGLITWLWMSTFHRESPDSRDDPS
jgi:hypothetical protein